MIKIGQWRVPKGEAWGFKEWTEGRLGVWLVVC